MNTVKEEGFNLVDGKPLMTDQEKQSQLLNLKEEEKSMGGETL